MNPKALALCAALIALAGPASAQTPAWTQSGMLTCKLNPSIGFIIVGHQSMECRFVPSMPAPPQFYEGALNTVGIDIGVVGGGALAGTYVGASGDVALGVGVGANVLVGGSNRSFALQPVSVEGSVALDVTLG